MAKVFELEQKYKVHDPERLLLALKGICGLESEESFDVDIYFSDCAGTYIHNNTCLRLRISEKSESVTLDYKGPSADTSAVRIAKTESNIVISHSDLDATKDLLSVLGYVEFVTVKKKRRTFHMHGEEATISYQVDEVDGAGFFVEVEVLGQNEAELEKLELVLESSIKRLGNLSLTPVTEPYRDIVAREHRKKIISKETEAVAFDLDGTLLPFSNLIFFESWRSALNEFGINVQRLTYEAYLEQEVDGEETLLQQLMNEVNQFERTHLSARADEIYLQKIRRFLKDADIVALFKSVEIIKRSRKTALVTHSKERFINALREQIDLDEYFNLVLGREELEKLKPDPLPYLMAAEKLDVDVSKMLVVEDSAKGIQAGLKAGSRVLAIGKPLDTSGSVPYVASCVQLGLLLEGMYSIGEDTDG